MHLKCFSPSMPWSRPKKGEPGWVKRESKARPRKGEPGCVWRPSGNRNVQNSKKSWSGGRKKPASRAVSRPPDASVGNKFHQSSRRLKDKTPLAEIQVQEMAKEIGRLLEPRQTRTSQYQSRCQGVEAVSGLAVRRRFLVPYSVDRIMFCLR